MKVLKKGSERNYGKKLTCEGSGSGKDGGCGALLLVAPRDIKSHTYTDYGGGTDTDYYYTCPDCGAKTYVPYSSL